ncbi:MAG: tetratricopeptide repeat protein [Deltaproteobacteria bacterium]
MNRQSAGRWLAGLALLLGACGAHTGESGSRVVTGPPGVANAPGPPRHADGERAEDRARREQLLLAFAPPGSTRIPPDPCHAERSCDDVERELAQTAGGAAVHRLFVIAQQRCDASEFDECARAAIALLEDPTVALNPPLARLLIQRGCSGGSAAACAGDADFPGLVARARQHRGLAPETATQGPPGRAAFSPECSAALETCEHGGPAACAEIGSCFVYGRGAPLDQSRAAASYRRSCELGFAQGCTELGVMLYAGEGIPADRPGARAAFEHGCEGGDGRSCSEAGLFHLQGDGVPTDRVRARSLFSSGCTARYARACTLLAAMSIGSDAPPDDRARAMQSLQRLCDAGEPLACSLARPNR